MSAPNLMDYDAIVIQTSGGKDSQAMMDYVVGLAMVAEIHGRVKAMHADLGDKEWSGTKELVAAHCTHYGLPLDVVRHRNNKGEHPDLLDLVRQRGKWPSSTERYCTSTLKRDASGPLYTRLAAAGHRKILVCMGMRAQESHARAKLEPFSNLKRFTSGRKHVDLWLPIHDWTEKQVWERIAASGVRHHYAYDLGMPRVSCIFCIFAPKEALLIAGRRNPELLDEYCEVENSTGHDFRSDLRINSIREQLKSSIPVPLAGCIPQA